MSSLNPPSNNHHIKQTIAGPVCTKCNVKVNNKRLFNCCPNTISAHWKKHKCIVDNPGARGVARQLDDLLSFLHTALIGKDIEAALQQFGAGSTATRSKRQLDYCPHCGLVDKKNKLLKKHCAPAEGATGGGKCPGSPAKGFVWTNVYNQCVPEAFLHEIISGNSPLRRLKPKIHLPPPTTAVQQPQPPSTPTNASAAASQPITPHTVSTSSAATPSSANRHPSSTSSHLESPTKRIKWDPEILDEINSSNHVLGIEKHRMVMAQIADLEQEIAFKHYDFFLPICLRYIELESSNKLKQQLHEMVIKYKSASADEPRLNLLLRAAELSFTSQLSNLNVKNLDATLRGALYHIGVNADNDGADLLRGNTFVATNNLENVLKEAKYLLRFVYRSNAIDNDILEGIDEICGGEYDIGGDPNTDSTLDSFAGKLLDTNILSAIFLNPIMDGPDGEIIYQDYIAARTTKLGNQEGSVLIRTPNDISRSANALLRVIRHCFCDHLNFLLRRHKRDGMPNPRERWREAGLKILGNYQTGCVAAFISSRIRSAKCLDTKLHKPLNKLVELKSGDLFIAGSEIKAGVWKRTLPSAWEYVKKSLELLYPDRDALMKWLNLDNKMTLSPDPSQTSLLVQSETSVNVQDTVRLEDLSIKLPIPSPATVVVQDAIQKCFNLICFAYAYTGVGAGRGTEVVNMPEFKENQFIFNKIRYTQLSKKGEKHGVNTNQPTNHFLSPFMSRLVTVIEQSLLPYVSASPYYSVPQRSSASEAAGRCFAHVFGVNLDMKNRRQAVASIMNRILPSNETKAFVGKLMAGQFHHSDETHQNYYSDEVVLREGEDLIDKIHFIGDYIWNSLGEQQCPSESNIRSQAVMKECEEFHYKQAACKIFGPSAILSELQLQAIQFLDSRSETCHGILNMATGLGKSGIYNISFYANAMNFRELQRTLVISPYNGLLAQHHHQSVEYLNRTNVRVMSFESSDIPCDGCAPPNLRDGDLIFISISAFKKLVQYHRQSIFGIKRIIIDEFHNVIAEMFRFSDSYDALSNLASFGAKILCMSATANNFISDCAIKLMCLGNCKRIGDTKQYPVPNVAINLCPSTVTTLRGSIVNKVCGYIQQDNQNRVDFAIHIITLSIEEAQQICQAITDRSNGITAACLTSECSSDERKETMSAWSSGDCKVLVSTITDGIDNRKCKRVVIAGGSYNVVSLIQAIGRIRPPQQTGNDATVDIFDIDHSRFDQQSDTAIDDNLQEMVGANLITRQITSTHRQEVERLFSRAGYKNVMNGGKCLRREIFLQIGIESEDCGMCSKCLTDNEIVVTSVVANDLLKQMVETKTAVHGYMRDLIAKCPYCGGTGCNGIGCAPNHPCFGCHRVGCQKATCRLSNPEKKKELFRVRAGDVHLFCSYCFAPKTSQQFRDGMEGTQIFHKDDRGPNGENIQHCTFKDRVKRVLLYSLRNDNTTDPNTTDPLTYLKSAMVCEDSYYKFFRREMENMNHCLECDKLEEFM